MLSDEDVFSQEKRLGVFSRKFPANIKYPVNTKYEDALTYPGTAISQFHLINHTFFTVKVG